MDGDREMLLVLMRFNDKCLQIFSLFCINLPSTANEQQLHHEFVTHRGKKNDLMEYLRKRNPFISCKNESEKKSSNETSRLCKCFDKE